MEQHADFNSQNSVNGKKLAVKNGSYKASIFVNLQNLCVSSHIHVRLHQKEASLELLNQSADIGIVELDDTARENMTP